MSSIFPNVFLKKHVDRRLKNGHVWIYSNEIDTQRSPLNQFKAGELVTVCLTDGKKIGVGYLNPHSLICVRLLSRQADTLIDEAWFVEKLTAAVHLRQRLFPLPYYRLVFGESDGLAGLVIDRFNDVLVVQITTAGMESLKPLLLNALKQVFKPRAIVLRNDTSVRDLEHLENYVEIADGTLPEQVEVIENNTRFQVPPIDGQKTGWFYDHRLNRARLQHYAVGKRVLDVFSYLGGWGVQAANAGAKEVWCVDSSAKALELLEHNAVLNGVAEKITTVQGDAFDALKSLKQANEKFDVIVLDPPAFIKRRKDQSAGEMAYRRINQLALQLIDKGGIFVSASCSLHLAHDQLVEILGSTGHQSRHQLQIIEQGHQAPDHPIHPAIPETAYLKAIFCHVS